MGEVAGEEAYMHSIRIEARCVPLHPDVVLKLIK